MSATEHKDNDHFSDAVSSFGDRLEAARTAKGLTIQSMAEKIGVEPSKVEDWENNVDEPRANRIQMLAGLLNVSIVWLISGEGNGTSQVVDTYDRPVAINDALGEIFQLKSILSGALEKLEKLESRLQESQE